MRTFHIVLLLLPAVPARLVAQAEPAPVVQQGLDALRDGRCQDAFNLWTKSWPEAQKNQMTASCSALEQYGGSIHGYDVVRTLEITPHLRRVYVVLLYQIQPIYVMLVVYRPGDADWRVNAVNWNSDPDKVLPASVAPLQHPGS
jgi:hypothetical protein